ncbi:peroxide stress protein YaaA [Litoribrevibacter albus]|uniref:UPF0246 protein GCM10007876_15020 n=1 Tax=Litoribrevibacter albus TaxID=1473156 RepID=A0AA37SA97_9GAMM|nr:peroxide stress protein YaaA [Litoribrevibacter albus]GLQ31023.1 UPF0246 protein [Litoribrevibacter albus]
MLMVISPAKTLDYDSQPTTQKFSQPLFLDESAELVNVLKEKSPSDISDLMKISAKLGELNANRFQEWTAPFDEAQLADLTVKQAVLAFKGDVYTGLDAETLSEDQLDFTQQHLRILSGLYGILKPLDLIRPYRLEMGTKLENARGKNLYEFWGDNNVDYINQQLETLGSDELVNLASTEYFKSVNTKKLKGKLITPVFKDEKNGKYKIISFYAKKARGLMVRYVVDNKITKAEDLKKFDYQGYQYAPEESTADEWVFKRAELTQ